MSRTRKPARKGGAASGPGSGQPVRPSNKINFENTRKPKKPKPKPKKPKKPKEVQPHARLGTYPLPPGTHGLTAPTKFKWFRYGDADQEEAITTIIHGFQERARNGSYGHTVSNTTAIQAVVSSTIYQRSGQNRSMGSSENPLIIFDDDDSDSDSDSKEPERNTTFPQFTAPETSTTPYRLERNGPVVDRPVMDRPVMDRPVIDTESGKSEMDTTGRGPSKNNKTVPCYEVRLLDEAQAIRRKDYPIFRDWIRDSPAQKIVRLTFGEYKGADVKQIPQYWKSRHLRDNRFDFVRVDFRDMIEKTEVTQETKQAAAQRRKTARKTKKALLREERRISLQNTVDGSPQEKSTSNTESMSRAKRSWSEESYQEQEKLPEVPTLTAVNTRYSLRQRQPQIDHSVQQKPNPAQAKYDSPNYIFEGGKYHGKRLSQTIHDLPFWHRFLMVPKQQDYIKKTYPDYNTLIAARDHLASLHPELKP